MVKLTLTPINWNHFIQKSITRMLIKEICNQNIKINTIITTKKSSNWISIIIIHRFTLKWILIINLEMISIISIINKIVIVVRIYGMKTGRITNYLKKILTINKTICIPDVHQRPVCIRTSQWKRKSFSQVARRKTKNLQLQNFRCQLKKN